jgi:hypothetical protein
MEDSDRRMICCRAGQIKISGEKEGAHRVGAGEGGGWPVYLTDEWAMRSKIWRVELEE